MINSERDLERAHEALGDLYRAIASLRGEIGTTNPATFAILAEGPLHEIERIQSEIEAFTGVSLARLEHAPLWLRLVGRKARWGETSASVLTAFLDALRKGVQSIASYNIIGRIGRRPSAEIQRACDLELVNFVPGSFQVGIRIPEPDQADLFPVPQLPFAETALTEFLSAADWAASDSPVDAVVSMFQDAPKRRVALRAVKAFVPRTSGGIDFVELSGSAVPLAHTVHLAPQATHRIVKALETAVSAHEEQHEGEIREIDLDKQTFKLRNVPTLGEVRCHFGDDIYPFAIELLGKRVRVIGMRAPRRGEGRGMLEVGDLEKLEPQA